MPQSLITVFGATGAQGGGLVRALLAAARPSFRVRAVTRRPGSDAAHALADLGAEPIEADLDDPASVRRAMRGAHGAFCVTNRWEHLAPARERARTEAMAEAARLEGLRHVVWSTLDDTGDFLPADGRRMPVLMGRYDVPHFDAEGEADRFFAERGVPLTWLYTSFHWDKLVRFGMAPRRDADGVLRFVLPMGDARMPGIAAADVGACAAGIFQRGEAMIGRRIGVAGEHLSGAEMAAKLSRALGEPVRHEALSPRDHAAAGFPGAGFPGAGFPGADDLATMYRFKRDFNADDRALRRVEASRALHPGLLDFDGWLAHPATRIPIPPAVPPRARGNIGA